MKKTLETYHCNRPKDSASIPPSWKKVIIGPYRDWRRAKNEAEKLNSMGATAHLMVRAQRRVFIKWLTAIGYYFLTGTAAITAAKKEIVDPGYRYYQIMNLNGQTKQCIDEVPSSRRTHDELLDQLLDFIDEKLEIKPETPSDELINARYLNRVCSATIIMPRLLKNMSEEEIAPESILEQTRAVQKKIADMYDTLRLLFDVEIKAPGIALSESESEEIKKLLHNLYFYLQTSEMTLKSIGETAEGREKCASEAEALPETINLEEKDRTFFDQIAKEIRTASEAQLLSTAIYRIMVARFYINKINDWITDLRTRIQASAEKPAEHHPQETDERNNPQ